MQTPGTKFYENAFNNLEDVNAERRMAALSAPVWSASSKALMKVEAMNRI